MQNRFAFNSLGFWFAQKALQQQADKGTQHAARMLKKQGVPVSLAIEILARRHVGVAA